MNWWHLALAVIGGVPAGGLAIRRIPENADREHLFLFRGITTEEWDAYGRMRGWWS